MDSEDQVSSAKRRLSELESEANRKKKITIRTVCIAIMIALALALIIVFVVLPAQKQEALNAAAYQSAITKLDRGKYDDAKNAFKALGGYKDSSKLAREAEEKAAAAKEEENRQRYQQGVKYMEEAQYDDAFLVFSSLKDYSDSNQKLTKRRLCETSIHSARPSALWSNSGRRSKMGIHQMGPKTFSGEFLPRKATIS